MPVPPSLPSIKTHITDGSSSPSRLTRSCNLLQDTNFAREAREREVRRLFRNVRSTIESRWRRRRHRQWRVSPDGGTDIELIENRRRLKSPAAPTLRGNTTDVILIWF